MKVKKEYNYITKEEYIDISPKEIAEDILDRYCTDELVEQYENGDLLKAIEYYIEYCEIQDVSEEDKDEIISRYTKLVEQEIKDKRAEESATFKDRSSIINFFEDLLYDNDNFIILSYEDIIDLIIQNGKK